VTLVYEELRKVVNEIEMPELHRFQNLRRKIVEIMLKLLGKQLTSCTGMVRSLIQVQDAYINTYHPDFMGGANSIVNVFDVNSYNKLIEAKKK
jgi:dynamin 1-like protein